MLDFGNFLCYNMSTNNSLSANGMFVLSHQTISGKKSSEIQVFEN